MTLVTSAGMRERDATTSAPAVVARDETRMRLRARRGVHLPRALADDAQERPLPRRRHDDPQRRPSPAPPGRPSPRTRRSWRRTRACRRAGRRTRPPPPGRSRRRSPDRSPRPRWGRPGRPRPAARRGGRWPRDRRGSPDRPSTLNSTSNGAAYTPMTSEAASRAAVERGLLRLGPVDAHGSIPRFSSARGTRIRSSSRR